MSYLLDTNVLSEAQRKTPNQKVISWLSSQEATNSYISVLSLGEIEAGISYLGETKKAIELRSWFEILQESFYERVLLLDSKTLLTWGKLKAETRRNGHNVPIIDSLLAATAITHKLILVTRNTDDFIYSGVTVLNPWLQASCLELANISYIK